MRGAKPVILLLLVGLLSVVSKPLAFGQLHIGESCSERRLLWTASIDSELYLVLCLVDMAHSHLAELLAVVGTFYAEVILSATQAIPHCLHRGRNFGSSPIGIAVVGNNTAQMLEVIILVFNRTFQPVLTVKIQHHAALVETMMAFSKVGLHNKLEESLSRGHLQHRSIVVAEMIVSALPEICAWSSSDTDSIVGDFTTLW